MCTFDTQCALLMEAVIFEECGFFDQSLEMYLHANEILSFQKNIMRIACNKTIHPEAQFARRLQAGGNRIVASV